jgi:hypothetical protein
MKWHLSRPCSGDRLLPPRYKFNNNLSDLPLWPACARAKAGCQYYRLKDLRN